MNIRFMVAGALCREIKALQHTQIYTGRRKNGQVPCVDKVWAVAGGFCSIARDIVGNRWHILVSKILGESQGHGQLINMDVRTMLDVFFFFRDRSTTTHSNLKRTAKGRPSCACWGEQHTGTHIMLAIAANSENAAVPST